MKDLYSVTIILIGLFIFVIIITFFISVAMLFRGDEIYHVDKPLRFVKSTKILSEESQVLCQHCLQSGEIFCAEGGTHSVLFTKV